jgi:hypothetical protein
MNDNNDGTEENRPVGKRFVKGKSGNPKGRPPKHECLTSLLKEELERVNPSDKQGRTWMELVVMATLRLAIKGKAAALREVWDRIDGKVRQEIGVDMDVNKEIDRRLAEGRKRAAQRNQQSRASEIPSSEFHYGGTD